MDYRGPGRAIDRAVQKATPRDRHQPAVVRKRNCQVPERPRALPDLPGALLTLPLVLLPVWPGALPDLPGALLDLPLALLKPFQPKCHFRTVSVPANAHILGSSATGYQVLLCPDVGSFPVVPDPGVPKWAGRA